MSRALRLRHVRAQHAEHSACEVLQGHGNAAPASLAWKIESSGVS
jgi:hypothetical protein